MIFQPNKPTVALFHLLFTSEVVEVFLEVGPLFEPLLKLTEVIFHLVQLHL